MNSYLDELFNSPQYRASLARYHEINDAFTVAWRKALKRAVEETTGLNGRFMDIDETDSISIRLAGLPWVEWEDDGESGYWIACGIEHRHDVPESMWRTFIYATYYLVDPATSDIVREDTVGRVYLTDEASRDVNLLVVWIIAAIKDHRTRTHQAS